MIRSVKLQLIFKRYLKICCFVGVKVTGFYSNDLQLHGPMAWSYCIRWVEVGGFYPRPPSYLYDWLECLQWLGTVSH